MLSDKSVYHCASYTFDFGLRDSNRGVYLMYAGTEIEVLIFLNCSSVGNRVATEHRTGLQDENKILLCEFPPKFFL